MVIELAALSLAYYIYNIKSGGGGLSTSEPATEPVSLFLIVAKATLDNIMTSQSEWTIFSVAYGAIA